MMQSFNRWLETHSRILMEGAVVERLKRSGAGVHPELLNSACLCESKGRTAMSAIYEEYIRIAHDHHLPLILLTPTWRAEAHRIRTTLKMDADELFEDAVQFMHERVTNAGLSSETTRLGGLIAIRGDVVKPAEWLSEEDAFQFHRQTTKALADAGVDFLLPSTLPALPEAVGLARACADTGSPYGISVSITSEGRLYDRSPLEDLLRTLVDLSAPPAFINVNCVHPEVFIDGYRRTMDRAPDTEGLVQGLQANTSRLSAEELDQAENLIQDETPETYADWLMKAFREFRLKMVGGCCGSDGQHIEALAKRLVSTDPRP
ncbi:homocysteine S-methyltransferase family protein [bacterium]|nr:homocysteine S-methyltransferase family protein [bacterium]